MQQASVRATNEGSGFSESVKVFKKHWAEEVEFDSTLIRGGIQTWREHRGKLLIDSKWGQGTELLLCSQLFHTQPWLDAGIQQEQPWTLTW